MGKATGMSKDISGKVGNAVYKQQPDGTTTVSVLPEPSKKELSDPQRSTLEDTKMSSWFISDVGEFINVGYELLAKRSKQNQFNTMTAHLRKEALIGTFPNRKLDYSKILVSQGKMEVPADAAVQVAEDGFSFTWNPEINPGVHYSDHVMLLAYFPELREARENTGGAQRRAGNDVLNLDGIDRGFVAHLYISFITSDRKKISNSVYLGQFTW